MDGSLSRRQAEWVGLVRDMRQCWVIYSVVEVNGHAVAVEFASLLAFTSNYGCSDHITISPQRTVMSVKTSIVLCVNRRILVESFRVMCG